MINPIKPIAIALIKAYQLGISPLIPPHCRFESSCSHYAVEAINTHGVFKGLLLSIRRLGRCHPFCEGGYDPVPKTPCRHGHQPNRKLSV